MVSSSRNPVLWLTLLVVFLTSTSGCLRRRMTIRSNPPGAQVYVDDYEIGTTPCSTEFIYYAKRNIRIVKDGFETLKVKHTFWPRWYQIPPLDFVSENLTPWEIRDERNLNYTLQPQVIVPTEKLLSRAENQRRGTKVQSSPFVPGSVITPSPAPSPHVGPETLPRGGRILPEPVPSGTPFLPQTTP